MSITPVVWIVVLLSSTTGRHNSNILNQIFTCFRTWNWNFTNASQIVFSMVTKIMLFFFRVLSRSTEAWNINFDNFLQWIMNNMTAPGIHYLRALKCLFYILLLIHRIKCLFIFGVYRPTWAFRTYGDVTIAGEGLHILTYARHSWLLRSEDSLANHTYCDTGHPFIMIISEDPWHFTCWAFVSGAVNTCFYDLGDRGSSPNLTHTRRMFYFYANAAVQN